MSEPILEVSGVSKHFPIHGGLMRKVVGQVQAVNNVSFTLNKGETLGVVGESGCGKSTLGRTICRLYEPTAGTIKFMNQDYCSLDDRELKESRRHMQMIFQDPYASLNPRMPIKQIIEEPYVLHKMGTAKEREQWVFELMDIVGLQRNSIYRYPHEFSGGQRQRIGIARAIALKPNLVICDEAVSALDVSIQSQVLNLLVELQKTMGLTYIFISHDLAVVRYISDRIAVMYLGQVVEIADRDTIYEKAAHPYTRALIASLPVPDPTKRKIAVPLEGDVPSPANPPSGCRFHTRCAFAKDICKTTEPTLSSHDSDAGHQVACHFAGKI